MKKLIPIVGFCVVSFLSSSAMADQHVREVVNCATQQCMETTEDGTVRVSTCRKDKRADRAVQWWHTDTPNPGFIENAYVEFGKPCLSMIAGVAGYDVVTTDCDSGAGSQKWTFGKLGEADPIQNAKYGQCLTAVGGEYVKAAKCDKGDLYQQWGFAPVGEKPNCPREEGSRMKLPIQAGDKPICSIAPPNICVLAMNECGQPLLCVCPMGYKYNPATGTCDWSFPNRAQDSQDAPVQPIPPIEPPPCTYKPRVCARDLNECGNPSQCSCAEGYSYNPATRMCDLVVK